MMINYIKEAKTCLINSSKVSLKEKLKFTEIILVGSGSSYHAALACKNFLRKNYNIYLKAVYPNSIDDFESFNNALVIGISQSGESVSTINFLKRARLDNVKTISLTANLDSKITKETDICVDIECGIETSVAKTKGFIMTYFKLIEIVLTALKKDLTTFENHKNDFIDGFSNIFDLSINFSSENQADFKNFKDIKIVCDKSDLGVGLEAALKMLETLRVSVVAYEYDEFTHGIYNAINDDTCLIFTGIENDDQRLLKLLPVVKEWTNYVYVLNKKTFGKGFESISQIIPFQVLSAVIPKEKGIDPNVAKLKDFHQKVGSKEK